MATVSYVSADVRTHKATSADLTTGTLGETVVRGQPIYLSSADNKWYLTDGDTADPAVASFDGYALDSGDDGEVIAIQTGGQIYLGVDVTPGMLYVVSATAGETEEATSALVSGLNTTLIGYGEDVGSFNVLTIDKIETLETIYP